MELQKHKANVTLIHMSQVSITDRRVLENCACLHFQRVAWIASLCLSVRQTRDLWQNERKLCPDSYTTWKMIYPSFITRRMVSWGRLLIPKIKKLRICPACVGQLRLSVAMCVQLCICLRVHLLACSRQRSSPNFIHGYRDQFGEELIRFSRSWGQRWTHLRKSTSGKTKEEVDRQRQGGL